jgi:hypothetical protein
MKTILFVLGCVLALGMAANGQEAGSPDSGISTIDKKLLLYYPFDQDGGGFVQDASGGGRTGQVYGAQWVAEGARGGAYRFDSNEQCILATDAGLPQGDEPRSMSVWIKLNVLYPEMTTGLLTYGTHSYNHLSGVGMDWRNGRDQYYFTQHGGVALSQQKMEGPGVWHHLAYTYGGQGRHHLYVDGVPTDGMSELGGPIDTVLSGLLIIGGHPGSVGPNGGFLDEVRIYGRELSSSEVAELAAAKDTAKPVVVTPPVAAVKPVAPVATAGGTPSGGEQHQPAVFRSSEAPPEFRRIGTTPAVAEAMVLQWTSVPGRAYELHWTDDLTRGFTIIASNLVATGTEMAYTNVMTGARASFYKVKIQE